MQARPSFWQVLIVLGGLAMLAPLIIDTYLPALPAVAQGLGVPVGQVQFTLASINLGLAVGHIIYGPLADRFGRRSVLLVVMALFSLIGFASAVSPDIGSLNVLRFLHGLTGTASMILARAVIRDLYDGGEAAKMLAYVFVGGATMPILAPIIGGHLVVWFDWPSTFILMGIFGAVLTVLIWFLLPETGAKDPTATNVTELGRSFATLCRSRQFMLYTLGGVGPYAGLFAVLAGLSPLLIGQMGVTPTVFGYLFGAVMIGYLAAAAAAGRLAGRWGINRLILAGALLCALSGLASLWVIIDSNGATIPAIVLPAFGFMVGMALLQPGVTAGAMSPFPEMAGRASSVMGLAHYGAGALAALLIGLFADGTAGPMVIILAASGLFTLVSYVLIAKFAPAN